MTAPLLTCPLRDATDLVGVRSAARLIAERLGFERQAQTRVATAVSEIARNAVTHGRGGEATFSVDLTGTPPRLSIVVSDHGPGIADLERLLSGQVPFPPGLGRGLPSARRLIDEFDIDSAPGRGTTVTLAQRVPREHAGQAARRGPAALAAGLRQALPDPMAELSQQNRELLESFSVLDERAEETERLNRELEETNRGVVALYSELDDKADQLRQASDLKSRFLSHMSHEFRTPLSSIMALARLLADGVDGPLGTEQARQVEYIRRSAQDLLDMVNDLLDLAKVEAGKLDVRPAEFSVESLFSSLRGVLKPLQANPAVDLVFADAGAVPPLVADEGRVMQILRNFIANALRFTERGTVTVRARADLHERTVTFDVEDTGIGIAEQHLAVIFEEFAQVEGRLQRGGTGLGLPLSRRLATLLGGRVSVRSTPGRGSTFTLAIPLRWGETAERPGNDATPRLLVIDDEEAFRYVTRHIAQEGGYAVIEAADGETGLQMAHEQPPHIIVLDLQMPGVDGFEVLDRLGADASLRDVPVIVCTSRVLGLEQKRRLARAHAIVPKHNLSREGLLSLMATARPPQELS